MGALEDIYNCLDPKYTSKSQVHIAHHDLGKLRDTCNPPGPRKILRLIFLVD